MECAETIEKVINLFDTNFSIDRLTIKSYGIVLRYSRDGKPINVDTNSQIENGEWAIWDDRYDVVTAHRINKAKVDITQGYGSKYGKKTTYEVELLVWAKASKITQLQLYDVASDYIHYNNCFVESSNFDIQDIEKKEFVQDSLSVDSLLLTIKYNVVVNSNICITNCKLSKC